MATERKAAMVEVAVMSGLSPHGSGPGLAMLAPGR
jgi:hypothetical protein